VSKNILLNAFKYLSNPLDPYFMKIRKESNSKKGTEALNLETMFLDNSQMKIMFKISDSTLFRWRKTRIVNYKKIGRKYYYPFDLIVNFMKIRNEQ